MTRLRLSQPVTARGKARQQALLLLLEPSLHICPLEITFVFNSAFFLDSVLFSGQNWEIVSREY